MKNPLLIFGLVFVIAIAGYLLFNRPPAVESQALVLAVVEPVKETVLPLTETVKVIDAVETVEAPTAVVEPAAETITLEVAHAEQLNDSDEALKAVMNVLNPSLLQWFNQEELLRKVVMAVDRVASGEIPTTHMPLQFSKAMFKVNAVASTADNEVSTFYVMPENHARFKPLVSALHTIDPAVLAAYYQDWLPLLEQAYAELGTDMSFDQRFHQALDQMLDAQPLAADTVLTQPHVFYEYEDKTLESANAVHKFLWRIGSENMASLQNYLRGFKAQL